jgi:hypothetical protein
VAVLMTPLIICQSARYVTKGAMLRLIAGIAIKNTIPEERTAAAATHVYGVDTNWYIDTVANISHHRGAQKIEHM